MLEGVESKAYYEQRQEFNVCATHRLGTEQWRFGVSQAGFARSHEKGRWRRVNRLASKMWPLLFFGGFCFAFVFVAVVLFVYFSLGCKD